MTVVEFRVLGPLECVIGGRPLRLGGAKRQAVLCALLLAEGRPLPLDRLIDAVWDARAPATAGKQIRNAVSDLRRLLRVAGPAITPVGDGYRLDLAGAELDLTAFTGHAARARRLRDEARPVEAVAEYRTALGLWRGPGLAGLESAMLRAQATGLDEQRLAVLDECVELELGRGEHETLVGELSTLVAQDPLRERRVAQLMVALCRSGAPARALTVYERTRRTLADELGVSPGPALRELHRRILTGDLATAASYAAVGGCTNLPADLGHFTGRTAELVRLADALRDPGRTVAPAVVVIDGMAGIGKTALAVHAAHQLAGTWATDRLYVDLRAHRDTALAPADALHTVLCTLGMPPAAIPPGLAERSAIWRRQLAGRRALVLLDDAADTEHIRPLLPGSPGCLTLVTSRRRLTGLDYTQQLSLSELSVAEGRELFEWVVGDDRPAAEPAATDAVLDRCGLLPLAVHAAGARLRHRPAWTVADLSDRLAEGRDRLAELEGPDGGPAAAFARSYELLPPEQQRLFRLLGTHDAAEIGLATAAELSGLPRHGAERLLEDLVDVHLLQEAAPATYRMHRLLRLYAQGLRTVPAPVPVPLAPAAVAG
jgi:DNA-binding SARP family transcriptional activator